MLNESSIQLRKLALEYYFSELNEMQQKAVFKVDGPSLILAGAGSGKTTVIINRIVNLIKFGNAYYDESPLTNDYDIATLNNYINGIEVSESDLRDALNARPISPWNILAITFTNKAANELKTRLYSKLDTNALNITAATFHSLCVRILRQDIDKLGFDKSFTIYDSDDSLKLTKSVLSELEISEKDFPPKIVISEISKAKDKLISPKKLMDTSNDDYRIQTIARVYSRYQTRLKEASAVDFDDLIFNTVKLFKKFPDVLQKYRDKYKYIMVDEYQDTNYAQFMLVSLLAIEHKNLCVVGDDDQSIYSFRGADVSNILNFEKYFEAAQVIKLERNYRSTKTILNAANSVIRNNVNRKSKALWTNLQDGEKILWYRAIDEKDEASFVATTIKDSFNENNPYSINAVLYRTNAQSNAIEKEFISKSIPYKIYGGMRFFDRKEIKDIIAYLSIINNPFDTVRFARIANEPKRGIGDVTLSLIFEVANDLKLPPVEVMRNASEYPPLAKKANLLKSFVNIIDDLTNDLKSLPLNEFVENVVKKTGYIKQYETLGIEGETRIENIKEFYSNIIQYVDSAENPTLNNFLEEVALYSEADRDNSSDDRVTLMTIHSAKGLEFKNVFIVGMEENLFPSARSLFEPKSSEEERRLAYVALTRAKEKLFLCSANSRMLYGQTQQNVTSRFIKEIDASLIIKKDNTLSNKRLNNIDAVTPVTSTSLQQQLAKNENKKVTITENFDIGDRIKHTIFGEGSIIDITDMAGDKLLNIQFDTVGPKKLMLSFAKINKV